MFPVYFGAVGQGMRPCNAGYGSSCMATGAFGLAAAAAAVAGMLGAPRAANAPRVTIAPDRVRTKARISPVDPCPPPAVLCAGFVGAQDSQNRANS